MKYVLEALKKLTEKDHRILVAIEHGMSKHEYVPVKFISNFTGLSEEYVLERLKYIRKFKLVKRTGVPYIGYVLTYKGYDFLALKALREQSTLKAISLKPLGIGKEADVYEGVTFSDERVAVKFHRIGRTSFRKTRKYRTYVGGRRHISWLYQSRLAATKEFEALIRAFPKGISCPRPISHNRHVIVTSVIDGVLLKEVPPLEDPEEVAYEILENIKKLWKDVEIVHGDLSEYNIMITEDEEILIIDWPQWVSKYHPSAYMLLKRDVENIVKFFKRKYRVTLNGESFLEEVVKEENEKI